MASNFMTTKTEIDGIVDKLDLCNTKMANVIANLCIDKVKDRSLSDNTYVEILKILQDLPEVYKSKILAQSMIIVAKQLAVPDLKPKENKGSAKSDYFIHNR